MTDTRKNHASSPLVDDVAELQQVIRGALATWDWLATVTNEGANLPEHYQGAFQAMGRQMEIARRELRLSIQRKRERAARAARMLIDDQPDYRVGEAAPCPGEPS